MSLFSAGDMESSALSQPSLGRMLLERGLARELEAQVFSASDRLVLRRLLLAAAVRQAFDDGVVVSLVEKYDREARAVTGALARWIDHSMHGGDPAIVGPALHHVAKVDHQRVRHQRDIHPLPGAIAHLQTTVPMFVLVPQDGEGRVVRVFAGAQLAR